MAKDNNSFFYKSIDVNRAVLQNIFIYGCFESDSLSKKYGYSESNFKKVKRFYNTCMMNHIGSNYMIKPVKKSGVAAKASYMNYHRFGDNNNYLYSVYLWSSIAKMDLWRYTVIRQYIKELENEKNTEDKNNPDKTDFLNRMRILQYGDNAFKYYFKICAERNYEHVYEFLLKSCDDEKDIMKIIDGLCDALSLYGRKAPYNVPAYSIMRKLKKSYFDDMQVSSVEREIWDFTYDNYDSILCDDSMYTIIQSIKNGNVISYTQSYSSKSKQYIIPLKIMREFTLGRSYLFYGKKNSDTVSVIRIDNMYNVTELSIKKDFREEYSRKISSLNNYLNQNINSIWLSSDYTTKNQDRLIVLENVNPEALAYIRKNAPDFEYNPDDKTVKISLRKADDIKPFIRILGARAKISEKFNPLLYKEFSLDSKEINDLYSGQAGYHENGYTDTDDTKPNTGKTEPADETPSEFQVNKSSLHLFNKYNSYSNIMLEDIQIHLINTFDKHKNAESIDIEPAIHDSFENCGFNVNLSYYGKLIGRVINDLREVKESVNSDVTDDIFLRFNEVEETADNEIPPIEVTVNNQELSEMIPAQIFTDYEYEYLWYMLQDPEARSFLPEKTAKKIEEQLSSDFAGKSLDDIYITRFANTQTEVNIKELHNNIVPVSQAIHDEKKIKFTYKGREVTGSPFRLNYSLRERVPRLIIKCNDEEWIRRINIDKMRNTEILSGESCVSEEEIIKNLNSKKKYIEIVIHKNEYTKEKNVFERALRLFSSYEKYTWDDQKNNDYIIAVAYYDFDVLLKVDEEKNRRIYRMDTIVGDILSLGKYAEVLPECKYELPEKQECISYDKDMYNEIKRIYRKLDRIYNG